MTRLISHIFTCTEPSPSCCILKAETERAAFGLETEHESDKILEERSQHLNRKQESEKIHEERLSEPYGLTTVDKREKVRGNDV